MRDTTRLRLRPLEEGDALEFERVWNVSQEAWAPWTPAREPGLDPAERFRREFNRAALTARAGTHLRLAAFDADRLIGFFALNEIVRGVFQNAYASWQVSADRMRRGFGTEGVRCLLDIAFDAEAGGLRLHRVQANIMPTNAPSLRIAERVGFRREGVAERYLKIAGVWEDHVMLAMTRDEHPTTSDERATPV